MSTRNPPTSKFSSTADKKNSSATNGYTSSSRPRVPSGTMGGENERRNSTTSHARKQSSTTTAGERRVEKREVRERETEIRRTRSPLKHSTDARVNARSRAEKPSRHAERTSGSAATSRKTPEEPQGTFRSQCSPSPRAIP